jgi:hypothetical protein
MLFHWLVTGRIIQRTRHVRSADPSTV